MCIRAFDPYDDRLTEVRPARKKVAVPKPKPLYVPEAWEDEYWAESTKALRTEECIDC